MILSFLSIIVFSLKFLVVCAFIIPDSSISFRTVLIFPNSSIYSISFTILLRFWFKIFYSFSLSFILLGTSALIFETFLIVLFPFLSIYSSFSYIISSSFKIFPSSSNNTFIILPFLFIIVFSFKFLVVGDL